MSTSAAQGIQLKIIKQQIKLRKIEQEIYKEAENAHPALSTFRDIMVSAKNNFQPFTDFLDMGKSFFDAGGAEALQEMYKTIFSEDNIAFAKDLNTEFGRLASEGMANLLSATEEALPGITGLTLSIVGLWTALGPLKLIVLAITASLQWIVENWDSVAKSLDDLRKGWEGFWTDFGNNLGNFFGQFSSGDVGGRF